MELYAPTFLKEELRLNHSVEAIRLIIGKGGGGQSTHTILLHVVICVYVREKKKGMLSDDRKRETAHVRAQERK